ncbi:methyltransferase family protein [Sphingomonas abietis]|uniref:Isoprenylcysteine carboxylmethyltransferase family protein n=1 Tax=Sphingomonas abietis TaxID=3012344 RepID=A0ABY7NJF3_9SPHN|nr:isoprenylcysteine carboxylmethyltransferase family protein [Sphingomonas abietis]WBO21604.1 isoprenylcysteine carboxylmethyltransferase family protein [Sphingomonas abietis]
MMDASQPLSAQPSGPIPRSAVSSGVGLIGLLGLALFYAAARIWHCDAPWVPIAGLAACGVPMIAWSLLIDRVHRHPSTGIDWDGPPRSWRDACDTALVKLAGLWATWGVLACCYALGRWYWQGDYLYAMEVFSAALVPLVALSILYVPWLDRRLIDREDGAWAAGHWLMTFGRDFDPALKPKLAEHARSWAIKGFFTAFMFSTLPGNWGEAIAASPAQMWDDPVKLAEATIALMFLVDVSIGTVGYILTLRPLDAHIRSGNPFMQGWTAALICYPPFILMNGGGPLDYGPGQMGWERILSDHPLLLPIWAFALIFLTACYAWATVAFGIRFSNLTYRGILTHGPYRFTKHPAYLAKNLYWWLAAIPMLTSTGWADGVRNTAILALISGVYVWRAKTEERHLLGADPAYRAYADWMAERGAITKWLSRAARLWTMRAANNVSAAPVD